MQYISCNSKSVNRHLIIFVYLKESYCYNYIMFSNETLMDLWYDDASHKYDIIETEEFFFVLTSKRW